MPRKETKQRSIDPAAVRDAIEGEESDHDIPWLFVSIEGSNSDLNLTQHLSALYIMNFSFLALPSELIDPIIHYLNGSDLCSFRLTCRYLCNASDRAFLQHISRNHYFTVEDSLHQLGRISQNVYFSQAVHTLRLHPHSLTWASPKPLPALAREEVDYSRWTTHPLTSAQRTAYRRGLLSQAGFVHCNAACAALVNCMSKLSQLSRIEIGSWGPDLVEIEEHSNTMRRFRADTNIGLLHFDWHTLTEARARGTRASCDGDCSLTDDFQTVLFALAEVQVPLSELKAHYWSDAGLKCVQIDSISLPEGLLRSLTPAFSTLSVLHLCLGFEKGRQSPDEIGRLNVKKTWLSDLLGLIPQLEELKLVFDGWAQWEVRPSPEAPDWSGSIFHHFANDSNAFPRLRKLDLENMFVRWLDLSRFIEKTQTTLVEISLNRINVWNVISWTQLPPDSDPGSWITRFKNLLASMPLLSSVNLSWFCVNGRMMCFYHHHFRHCRGCDDTVTLKPTDYGIDSCPHYAFGRNRNVELIRGVGARRACKANTDRREDFLSSSVVMIPMHTAFPLYYQADENDFEAQWQYYDGTVGRWETPGPELDSQIEAEGGYFS